MFSVTVAPYPALERLLSTHPRIASVEVAPGPPLAWSQGDWNRRILVGSAICPLKGLVELMDNNPLVCADEFSVPSPAATLALIALGPLARAGLVNSPPEFLIHMPFLAADIKAFLATMGWPDGCACHVFHKDEDGLLLAAATPKLAPGVSLQDLVELYEESYGRSFFVHQVDFDDWHHGLAKGSSSAFYMIAEGEESLLPEIQVVAEAEGKCGAAQVVHAFNVMAGFEESLGL